MDVQHLPRVSPELVETIGAAKGQLDLETAIERLGRENPQIVMLVSGLTDFTPLMAVAVVYEMLHKQADIDWSNANLT
jgi:hypothetical protein